ncbi:hypothetical protein JCM11491_007200 [Sporobolomyces phaffii]
MTSPEPQNGQTNVSNRRPSISQDKLVPFSSAKPPAPGAELRLVFVGAGQVLFGGETGRVLLPAFETSLTQLIPVLLRHRPWDHSFRLEHHLGPRLKVLALIDPSRPTAEAVLDRKKSSFVASAYKHAKIYPNLDDFVNDTKGEGARPHAFIVGSPPAFRGSTKQGRDVELAIHRLFPTDTPAIFLEKPLSTDSPEEAQQVARTLLDSQTVVSVGYFLRYLRVVQQMRTIIEDNNLEVMSTVARYASTYSVSTKKAWWMKSIDCGPICEQATHFCDLSRYFGGAVDLDSISANQLDWDEPAGALTDMPIDEASIPPDDRIPRVTSANWKYESGAVGSLTHMLVLQGYRYSCELEVYADGYQLKLIDPYNNPELRVRTPASDEEHVYTFERDDPYASELNAFIDAADASQSPHTVGGGVDPKAGILCDYQDACKTYAFSWAIRRSAEENQKRFKKRRVVE